nr:putative rhamnosyl transferase [Sedimentitalea nanhaiensis]
MQVIGICRFSYPGLGGFQIQHDSLQDRIDYLYAPERLEERFRFFECITLPGIRAQFDPDFTFLVVIGESLPRNHRERLQALVADIPQVVIQSHPPGRHRVVMQDAINSVRQKGSEPCLQFRLDDDDAVAFSYVHKLRRAANDVAGLLRENRHIAIDFNQGYIARPGPAGIAAKPIQTPYWTAGLALMFRPNVSMSVMNFGHHSVCKSMPTVTFTGEDMMLRGHNDYNDSRQGPGIKPVRLTPLDADGELLFQMTYGIDTDHVRRVFSAPL